MIQYSLSCHKNYIPEFMKKILNLRGKHENKPRKTPLYKIKNVMSKALKTA